MGSCDVKIEVDRLSTGGTFTNHDRIRGVVTLAVAGSITLNYIQVKIEGISQTQLTIPRVRKNKQEDKVLRDVHKVLYDTLIVFPPDNVRKVSLAKDFTLTPGNYSYPFEFAIPLYNSCVKMLGILNKVLFNKNFDLMLNNGNFNTNLLRNRANQFINGNTAATANAGQQLLEHAYHFTAQLPPSLSGMEDVAKITYFVKATCKRSSFLKPNLRSIDPFIMLPLDLDAQNQPLFESEEYREVFVRKQVIFKGRIPEIVGVVMPPLALDKKQLPTPTPAPKKPGFFQKMFDPNAGPLLPPVPIHKLAGPHSYYPEIESKDVPFLFEIRFRYPAFLVPTKSPSFKLFLVSQLRPSRYTLAQYGRPDETNGLGIIYMQKLSVDLLTTTTISVLENDGSTNEIHHATHELQSNICRNTYQNLKFDLKNCKRLKSSSATSANDTVNPDGDALYELEIPAKFYSNCVLPDHLSPSFKTCNISRKYKLTVTGGFSCEKIVNFRNQQELDRKLRYVDLHCSNIKVLSGLNMTSSLHTASKTSLGSLSKTTSLSSGPSSGPKPPQRPPSFSSLNQPPGSPPGPPPPLKPLPSLGITGPAYVRPEKEDSQSFEASMTSGASDDDAAPLPTYDDVVRESTFQDDSEHQRARRRYQQHDQYYTNRE